MVLSWKSPKNFCHALVQGFYNIMWSSSLPSWGTPHSQGFKQQITSMNSAMFCISLLPHSLSPALRAGLAVTGVSQPWSTSGSVKAIVADDAKPSGGLWDRLGGNLCSSMLLLLWTIDLGPCCALYFVFCFVFVLFGCVLMHKKMSQLQARCKLKEFCCELR